MQTRTLQIALSGQATAEFCYGHSVTRGEPFIVSHNFNITFIVIRCGFAKRLAGPLLHSKSYYFEKH